MKKKKQTEYEKWLGVGVIFIAVGAAFTSSVNIGLGIAFIALGVLFMVKAAKERKP